MNSTAAQRARALILFADGVEQAGWADYAQKARDVAHDLLKLADQLEAERSARGALQARCQELQELIGQAAYASTSTSAGWDDIPF